MNPGGSADAAYIAHLIDNAIKDDVEAGENNLTPSIPNETTTQDQIVQVGSTPVFIQRNFHATDPFCVNHESPQAFQVFNLGYYNNSVHQPQTSHNFNKQEKKQEDSQPYKRTIHPELTRPLTKQEKQYLEEEKRNLEEEKQFGSQIELKKMHENDYFNNFMNSCKQKKATSEVDRPEYRSKSAALKFRCFMCFELFKTSYQRTLHENESCSARKPMELNNEMEGVNPLQDTIANIIKGLHTSIETSVTPLEASETVASETVEPNVDDITETGSEKNTEGPLICVGCGEVFTNVGELNLHMAVRHSESEVKGVTHEHEKEYMRLSEELRVVQANSKKDQKNTPKEQHQDAADTTNVFTKLPSLTGKKTLNTSKRGGRKRASRGRPKKGTVNRNSGAHNKVSTNDTTPNTKLDKEKNTGNSSDDEDVILIEPKIELIVLDSSGDESEGDNEKHKKHSMIDNDKVGKSEAQTLEDKTTAVMDESVLLKQFGIKNVSVKLARMNPTVKVPEDTKSFTKPSDIRNVSCSVRLENIMPTPTKYENKTSPKDKDNLARRVKPEKGKRCLVDKIEDETVKRQKSSHLSSDELLMKKYGIKDVSINVVKSPVSSPKKEKSTSPPGLSCNDTITPGKITGNWLRKLGEIDVKHRVTRSIGMPTPGNNCAIGDCVDEEIPVPESNDPFLGFDDSVSGISCRSFNSVKTDDQMSVLSSGSVSPQPSTSSGFIYIPPKRTARKSVKDEDLKRQYLLKEPRVLLKTMTNIELAMIKNPHSHFGKPQQNDVDSDESQDQNISLTSLLDSMDDTDDMKAKEVDSIKGKGKALSKNSKSCVKSKSLVDMPAQQSNTLDAGLLKKFGITRSIVVIKQKNTNDNIKHEMETTSSVDDAVKVSTPSKRGSDKVSQNDVTTGTSPEDRRKGLKRTRRNSLDKTDGNFSNTDSCLKSKSPEENSVVRSTRSKPSPGIKASQVSEKTGKPNVKKSPQVKTSLSFDHKMDICKPFSISLTPIDTSKTITDAMKVLQTDNTISKQCDENVTLKEDAKENHVDGEEGKSGISNDLVESEDSVTEKITEKNIIERINENNIEDKDTFASEIVNESGVGVLSEDNVETPITDKNNDVSVSSINDTEQGIDTQCEKDDNTDTQSQGIDAENNSDTPKFKDKEEQSNKVKVSSLDDISCTENKIVESECSKNADKINTDNSFEKVSDKRIDEGSDRSNKASSGQTKQYIDDAIEKLTEDASVSDINGSVSQTNTHSSEDVSGDTRSTNSISIVDSTSEAAIGDVCIH